MYDIQAIALVYFTNFHLRLVDYDQKSNLSPLSDFNLMGRFQEFVMKKIRFPKQEEEQAQSDLLDLEDFRHMS